MRPWPQPNSVIVLDNASIHKSVELCEMVVARYVYPLDLVSTVSNLISFLSGMRIIFLPAYSPDFNPIEEAFSAIKAWMRRNRLRVCAELSGAPFARPHRVILDAVFSVTAEMSYGWFRHAGYCV